MKGFLLVFSSLQLVLATFAQPSLGPFMMSTLTQAGNQESRLADAQRAFNDKQYQKAVDLTTAILAEDPKSAQALNTRACALDILGKDSDALKDFDRALALEPLNDLFLSNRGRVKYGLKDYKGALLDLDQAIAVKPGIESHRRWRAYILFAQERYAEALVEFRKASELDPKSALDMALIARTLRYARRLDEALLTAQKACQMDPKGVEPLRERARTYISLGDYKNAQADISEELKRNPKDSVAHYDQARILRAQGNDADALTQLNAALTIDGNYSNALRVRAEVLRGLQRTSDAIVDEKKYEGLTGLKYTPSDDSLKAPIPLEGRPFTGWVPDTPGDEKLWKRSDTPWRKDEPPLKATDAAEDPATMDFEEYQAMVRQAMEMVRSIYGDLTPAESDQFQAKWAPVLDFPSQSAFVYFRKLNPLLKDYLNLKGAFTMASSEFDQTWERAGLAAGLGDEETARNLAAQADEIQRTMQALLARLRAVTAQIKALGDPPNPMRAKKRAQDAFDRALNKVGTAATEATGGGLVGEWEGTVTTADVKTGAVSPPGPVHIFLLRPPPKSGAQDQIVMCTLGGYDYGHYMYRYYRFKDLGGGQYLEDSQNGLVMSDFPIRATLAGDHLGLNTDVHYDNAVIAHATYSLKRIIGDDLGPGPAGCTLADAAALTAEADRMSKTEPPKTGNENDDIRAGMEWHAKANALANRAYLIGLYFNTRYVIHLALKGFKPQDPQQFIVELPDHFAAISAEAKALTERDKADAAKAIPTENNENAVLDSEAAAKKARTEEINIDIASYEHSLAAWRSELAKEKDPGRARQLQQNIIAAVSAIQEDQALVASIQSGTIITPRTLWQELAHQKLIEDSEKEARKPIFFNRAEKQVDGLIDLLEGPDQAEMRALKEKLIDPTARVLGDTEKLGQLMRAVHNKVLGQQGAKEAEAEDWINKCEEVKFGANLALMVVAPYAATSMTPMAGYAGWIANGYGLGTGYIDGGVAGAAEGGLRMYSAAADVAFAATDALRNPDATWTDAAKAGLLQLVLRKSLEKATGKLIQERLRTQGPNLTWSEAVQSTRFKELQQEGKVLADQYQEASAEFNAMVSKRAGGLNPEEYIKANHDELMQTPEGQKLLNAIGAVENSYTAKLEMNNPARTAKGIGKSYNANAETFLEKPTVAETQRLMREQGYNEFEISQIRHSANRNKVGMDHDLAVNEENFTPTKNGEPVTMEEFQQDLNKSMNKAYRKVTGGRSAEYSDWRGTTHVDPEAYLDRAVLELSQMRQQGMTPEQMLRALDPQTADQTAGVNIYKVGRAMKRPGIEGVAEATRTLTKELDTKVLPTLNKGGVEFKLFTKLRAVLANGTTDPVGVQNQVRMLTGRSLNEVATMVGNRLALGIRGGG